MSNELATVTTFLKSDKMLRELKAALPAHVKVEKFVRVAITAVNNNPALLGKDRASLYTACVKAATDGLVPDGREAALVPFGKDVQYMPMTKGILKLARNSGELKSISAHVVYRGDEFEYWVDEDGEHVMFRPAGEGETAEKVFAIAKTKDGGVYIEVMSRLQVEKVRKASRSGNSGPWVQWWEEMAKKTAIRRLSKRLPMSTDMESLVQADDYMYDMNKKEESTSEVKESEPSRMKDIVAEAVEVKGEEI